MYAMTDVDNSKYSHDYVPRINHGGNFCGHKRLKPTLSYLSDEKKGKNGMPRVLTLMIERLQQYYKNPYLLNSLNSVNKSKRQQRSERRESCIRALTTMLEFTDLTTLKVAIPTSTDFVYLDNDYLAQRAQLHTKRFQRALSNLVDAGIVTVTKRVEDISEDKNNTVYRSLASIKCINKQLFAAFGLDKILKKERARASRKARMNENKYSSNAKARFNLAVRGNIARAQRANAKKKRTVSTETHDNHTASQEYQEAVQRFAYKLRSNSINISISDAEFAAHQHLSNLQNYLKFTQE